VIAPHDETPTEVLLKDNPNLEHDVKVYELYLQRIQKEGDLIWSRFKIYLGFNSGILIAMGLLTRETLGATQTNFNIPIHIATIIIAACLAGLILSIAWAQVNSDGRRWQNVMNQEIKKVEGDIFTKEGRGLYTAMIKSTKDNKQIDVVDINIRIAWFFSAAWFLAAILGAIYLIWKILG